MIPISNKYQHITSDNFVDEMVKLVQRFDKEPVYFIRPLQSNCVFEILVNDLLIYKEYSLEKLATPLDINAGILQSGTQTITVRLYPIGGLIKKTYGEGETVKTLLKKTQMQISVVKYEDFKSGSSLDHEILIKKHTTATSEGTDDFIGAGLDFYEYSFSFEAEVPYKIQAWTEATDLTEINRDVLEKQVLKYYKQYQTIYRNKDEELLVKTAFGDFLILAQTGYYNRKDAQKLLDEIIRKLYYKDKEFEEFNTYVMNFYGNGKIVALRHPSREPVDSRLRGRSALWFKYNFNGRKKVFFPGIFLYLPKGESLESLRRIEY